jgi:cytochrome o ubiquinol oxidase subunit 2
MKRNRNAFLGGLLSLYTACLLGGCSRMLLLDPKGPIGDDERFLILAAFVLMLLVVVPAICMAVWFALRYRVSNTKATYMPKWCHSLKIDLVIWLVPMGIVTVLGYLAWTKTYQLDPYRPIDHSAKPVSIEVVSLDWKWLFIYPDFNIATVNEMIFPANVPLSFRITSETVMTSFFIPQLGSQIYAMAGMQTRLHLMAYEPGVYSGQNQQFSGRGYSDMYFKAIATAQEEFEAWVQKSKQSPDKLDLARYEKLARPSVGYPVTTFSSVQPGLFDHILSKYMSVPMNPSERGRGSDLAPLTTRNAEDG